MYEDYLTEQKLGVCLEHIFNDTFVKNKRIVESNIKHRPDYANENLKLIVEFDGYRHYNSAKQILSDKLKNIEYARIGYTVIRIPYFVQLTNQIAKLLFENYNINTLAAETSYKHGFIDNNALLPCDFNSLGLIQFKNDLETFDCIKQDILQSIKDKYNMFGYNFDINNLDIV